MEGRASEMVAREGVGAHPEEEVQHACVAALGGEVEGGFAVAVAVAVAGGVGGG